MSVRRATSTPPPSSSPITSTYKPAYIYDDDKDPEVPFGSDLDPDLAWCPGSVPAVPRDEVALVYSNIGPTLFDTHGSARSFMAKSVALALGGSVAVSDCAPVSLGGDGRGSALHCTANSVASFFLTIQYSFLDAHMRKIGICPFARECGARLCDVLIVDDAHLAALQGNLPAAPVLLLGRDALTVRPLETIFGLVLRAGHARDSDNYVALWTHPQQRKLEVPISGTHARRVHQGVDISTTLPYDTPPADAAEDLSALSPALEFLARDGAPRVARAWNDGIKGMEAALAAGATAASDALPGVPRSKDEMRERLLQSAVSAKLTAAERVYFDHYLTDLHASRISFSPLVTYKYYALEALQFSQHFKLPQVAGPWSGSGRKWRTQRCQ